MLIFHFMKLLQSSLAVSLIAALSLPSASAQTATTDPVGFVTVNITPGTGSAKKNTLFSVPLMEVESITGPVAGVITGVTSNSISNSNAGWTAGALSQPATPYLIQITSGVAEGRLFLIASSANTGGAISGTANTSTTVSVSSVDSAQTDLTSLGIVAGTDTYKIYACDTLSSFFGTPAATGIQGGASANTADSIIAIVNGSASTYFYNTGVTPARWARAALGSPDASNVPLLPYYGVQYSRIATAPWSRTVTGSVPVDPRKVAVKNSGNTILSQFWPVDSTLATSGLSTVVTAGANANTADTVRLTSAGSVTTYFYDGTNWRRQALGSPLANDTPIPLGTAMQIFRRGAAAGYTTLNQAVPYAASLQ
jgi:hypothetical protein